MTNNRIEIFNIEIIQADARKQNDKFQTEKPALHKLIEEGFLKSQLDSTQLNSEDEDK